MSKPPFIFHDNGDYYGRFTLNKYADDASGEAYIRRFVALLCQH